MHGDIIKRLAERVARWLSPELSKRVDDLSKQVADLTVDRDRWSTAFEEAAKYDAAEDVAYREEMSRIYGVSPYGPLFSRRVPKRPIGPAMAATLRAGRSALDARARQDPVAQEGESK